MECPAHESRRFKAPFTKPDCRCAKDPAATWSASRKPMRLLALALASALVVVGCCHPTDPNDPDCPSLSPGKGLDQDFVDSPLGPFLLLLWLSGEIDPAPPSLGGTPPYYPFLMRQPDCSLTRYVIDSTETVVLQEPNYQNQLHQRLQVPTTPDKFPNGCQDSSIGVSGQAGAIVGKPSGNTAVAILGPAGVVVSIVTSTGSISAHNYYPVSSGTAYYLATADLNGDGVPDMVVTSEPNSTTGTLTVLVGKGDGTFTTGQSLSVTLPSSGSPLNVTIDDVNGDGKLDLIAVAAGTSTASGITVFLGNGDGTFSTSGKPGPNNAGGTAAVTGDFNKDGKKDIATSYGQILLGNGDGTFSAGTAISQEGQQPGIAAADFNQDGKMDLAFTNSRAATVDVYFGNGDGTFAYAASYPTMYGATTVETSDLDGDGFADLFLGTANSGVYTASQFSESFFQSMLNYGNGTFGPSQAYFPGPPSQQFDLNPGGAYLQYATANFTSSGKPDLLMLANGTSSAAFSVLKSNGDGTFSRTAIQTQLSGPAAPQFIDAIASGDMNGDGKPDTVFGWTDSSGLNPHISVALGNGDGTFQAQQDYALPAAVLGGSLGTAKGLVLADLRGTGKPDVVFLTGSQLYVMLNNGDSTLGAPTLVDSRPWMNYLAAQSLRSNGKADIAVAQRCNSANNVTGSAFVYLGNGDGTFQTATQLNPGFGCPNVVAIADMNGDSKPDLVFAGGDTDINTSSDFVAVFLGNGDGTVQTAKTATVAAPVGSLPTGIAVAPFFANSTAPSVILGQLGPFGDLFLLPGNGDGTFNTSNAFNVFAGMNSRELEVTDLTGQGLPDLLLTSGGAEANGTQLSVEVFAAAKPTPALAATTATLKASASTITSGQSVTFTATVTSQSGSGTPTGSVNFLDGTSTIGSGTLNGSGVVSFATSSLAAGSHSITAAYQGDSSFAASTSSAVSVQVNAALAATTTTLMSSASTVTAGQSVTFTATVAPQSGSGTPTGIVNFLDGTTMVGSGTLNGSGVATFSTSSLASGTHSVTAAYQGDTNFAASTSSAVSVHVNAGPPDFSVSASPSSQSVSPGQSTNYTMTLTPINGFNQAVSVTCSGAPETVKCTPTSASVTLNGTSASQIQVNITTRGSSRGHKLIPPMRYRRTTPVLVVILTALWLLAWMNKLDSKMTFSRLFPNGVGGSVLRYRFALLALAMMLAAAGCSNYHTAAGMYRLTLKGASGNVTHSATVSLIVQ